MDIDITTVTPGRYLQLEQEVINILINVYNTWNFKEQSISAKVLIKESAIACNTVHEVAIVILMLEDWWKNVTKNAPVG